MTNLNKELKKHLGITLDDIDKEKAVTKLIESFVYHEEMVNKSLSAISDKSDHSQKNHHVLWDSFETNNTLAYSLRSILLASVPEELQ